MSAKNKKEFWKKKSDQLKSETKISLKKGDFENAMHLSRLEIEAISKIKITVKK